MAEQMVFAELLTENCGNECQRMLKEKLTRKRIVIPAFTTIVIIIVSCVLVGVFYEKQSIRHVDCVLKTMVKTYNPTACLYVDQYPLSNDVFARICVNETQQIDIRRFYNHGPSEDGITLSLTQWQYLKKSVNHIDQSILQSQKNM